MVLGVGPCMHGRRRFWVWGLATRGEGPGGRRWSVGDRLARRSWQCWSPLVSGAAPRHFWRRALLVRVAQVLSMSVASAVAGVAPGDVEGGSAVGDDPAGGGRCRCDADDEAGAGGGPADVAGDGSVGDAPGVPAAGDVDGERAAGGAPGVGAAGDAYGKGVAGDALVYGAAGDAMAVRVP